MVENNAIKTKQWYIKIDEGKEGPFSAEELRRDPRVTLETLVWKKGFDQWVPIRRVWELRAYFEEKKPQKEEKEEEEEEENEENRDFLAQLSPEGLVIDMRGEEPPNIMWMIIIIVAVAYLLIKIFYG